MKIISYNVNGIRAAITKGFLEWLQHANPDVICLQEIKATEDQIPKIEIEAAGYPYQYYFPAEKKGYSGVAVFSKQKPSLVVHGNGHGMSDAEGRVIRVDFGDLTIINAYFPSGTSGDLRQTYKYQWLTEFFEHIQQLRKTQLSYNLKH